jgi:hypothetical protein
MWRFLFIRIIVQSSVKVAIFRKLWKPLSLVYIICLIFISISLSSTIYLYLSDALWRIYVLVTELPSYAFNIIHNIRVVNLFLLQICVLLLWLLFNSVVLHSILSNFLQFMTMTFLDVFSVIRPTEIMLLFQLL